MIVCNFSSGLKVVLKREREGRVGQQKKINSK